MLHGRDENLQEFVNRSGEWSLLPPPGVAHDAQTKDGTLEVGEANPVIVHGLAVTSLFGPPQDDVLASDSHVHAHRGLVLADGRKDARMGGGDV